MQFFADIPRLVDFFVIALSYVCVCLTLLNRLKHVSKHLHSLGGSVNVASSLLA